MKLKFIQPSDHELFDAYYFYEEQLTGLGDKFLYEFNQTIKLVIDQPNLWRKVGSRTRKALLKRFPYFILYIYENEIIYITCIAHQHRDPEYYSDRLI